MALDAFIFDLDGTLLDTNPVHIEAWRRAFEKFGFAVAPDRIAPEIAHEGEELIASILGKSIAEESGEKLHETVKDEVLQVIKERAPLPVFPEARELLLELKKRGIKTALATAASEKQLDALVEGSGFDVHQLCDVVTKSDDAKAGKPAPDLLLVACEKLQLSPAQCAFVGDAIWDAKSARRAGAVGIGILAGSAFEEKSLREAGTRLVFRDVAELLKNLDDALQKAAPSTLHLTRDVQEHLMREALQAARDGMKSGGVPIGAVLARPDENGGVLVISSGFNELHITKNPTDHAEIVTFRNAAGKIPQGAKDLILVSSLEPCVMCLGAAMESAVDVVLFGLQAPADNGTTRVAPPQSPESQMPRIVGGVLAAQSRALFEEWMAQNGDDRARKNNGRQQQAAFVQQLLELTEREA